MAHKYLTVYESDHEMIKAICSIHNGGKMVHADVTYRNGSFYGGLPRPKLKYDLFPQTREIIKADAANLPVDDGYLRSIICDLPYLIGKKADGSKVKELFGCFRTEADMWKTYQDVIAGCARKLQPNGLFCMKVQDHVSSGKNFWLTDFSKKCMAESGIRLVDVGIRYNKNPRPQPGNRKQRHLQKAHAYWLVGRKSKNTKV